MKSFLVNARKEEGMALILALLAIIMVAGAVGLVMTHVINAQKSTDRSINEVVLDEGCKAAVDIGIERVWHQYVVGSGNTTGNLASYRTFIDNVVRNNEVVNGVQRDYNGDGRIDTNPAVDIITTSTPRPLQSGARITGLRLSRTDDVTGVILTFAARTVIGQQTKNAQQSIRVSGARFAGFQFAVLANNINCILCHAEFRNLDMYETDPATGDFRLRPDASKFNSFDRVKVAALESLLIRASEADSRCAGSTYTRGKVFNKDGSLLSASGIASSLLKAYNFSNLNGKMTQNTTTGSMSIAALANAAVGSSGRPSQFANLYLNYPTDSSLMSDGELPLNFPAPFPDDNGNRKVDATEFQKYVNSANGAIHFDLPPDQVGGTITAGVAYGVAAGSTYTGTDLPATSSSSTLSQLASGSYTGNLILVGTDSDPIVINGKVAVNGDVVIKGKVKGSGQLMASGNVYVMGDVTYADAPGKFGEAADGTPNAFALEAGGNIMLGDYVTIRAKNDYVATKNGTKYDDRVNTDVWQGKFVDVSQSTATTNMSTGKPTAIGYFDAGAADPGYVANAGTVTGTSTYVSGGKTHTVYTQPEAQYSFTTSEIMLFNRMERLKSAPPGNTDYNASYYIAGYTPRYYKLRDDAPIYQYKSALASSDLKEHAVNYGSPGVKTLNTTSTSPDYIGANAAVLSLAPKNGWISENVLRRVWFNDEAARRANPTVTGVDPKNGAAVRYAPFKFDGLLYTNNCIFGLTRGNTRHKSMTYGKLWIRGSIVCADLGLLSADTGHEAEYRSDGTTDPYYGGIEVYYDKRVDAFLNVEDPTQVTFARLAYQYAQS